MALRGRLPGATRLATGSPPSSGRKEKSVSSLLSRNPWTRTAAAECRFDAAGHGDRVARGVDDRQVGGAGRFHRRIRAERPGRAGGCSRQCPEHAFFGFHQQRAIAQVTRIDQTGRRNLYEIRVADVVVAVGIGEASRLREQVHRPARIRPYLRHVEALERAEDGQHGDAARTGRRHAADAMGAVAAADRFPRQRAIGREVLLRHVARPRHGGHRGDDVARDVAEVESVGSFVGDAAKHRGEFRVLQPVPHRQRAAVGRDRSRRAPRDGGEAAGRP